MSHAHRRPLHGFTLVGLLVVIAIIALVIAIMLPALSRSRETANRVKCASNLRQLGQAMMLYANDNRGSYPRTQFAPGDSVIPDITNAGFDSGDPFRVGNKVPANCVTSALFLLLRTEDIVSSVLICPSSDQTPDDYGGGAATAQSRCNFTDLSRNLSYGLSNPYPDNAAIAAGFKWNSTMDPSFALVADRASVNSDALINIAKETLFSDAKAANSPNHNTDGQNILYADGHVEFQNTVLAGKNRDNIYLRGTSPSTDKSVLINSSKDADDSVILPAFQ